MSKHLRMAGASRAAWTHQEAANAFALHARRVERVAARILKDRDEARDVASETFVALLEGGPDDRQATESWLLTTARNRALNRLRERARAERAVHHLASTPPALELGLPDDAARKLVSEAAAMIGDRERAAVHLRFSEDRSYDEIATRLGITAGNARVLVHRALRRLRQQAVDLLAAQHGASDRCRRALARGASAGRVRTHDGCSPCTAVSDELAAMTASGMLPVALPAAGAFARLLDLPLQALTRLRNPASGRTAEAVAALLVTGTVGLGTPAVTPPRAESATVAVTAPHTLSIAVAARTGKAAGGGAGTVSALRPSPPALTAPDAADDNNPVPAGLVPIGAPLLLRDAMEGASATGLDIRTFEIVRLGDARGRTAGLLFRLGLDAPPRPQAEYRVDWQFDRPGCRGDLVAKMPGTFDWSEPRVSVDCYDPDSSPSTTEPSPRESLVRLNVVRATLEITIVFDDLVGTPARMLRSGALLKDLRASTVDYRLAGMTSDAAPDHPEPGLRFTI